MSLKDMPKEEAGKIKLASRLNPGACHTEQEKRMKRSCFQRISYLVSKMKTIAMLSKKHLSNTSD